MKVNILGVDFDIDYAHQPEEQAVMYYSDGTGYPGCPESLEITGIFHDGYDWYEILEPHLKMVEEAVYEQMRKDHE